MLRLYLEREWEIDRRSYKIGTIKQKWEYWPWCEVGNRKVEVSMARLRMGHSRLNSHMFRIGLSDSPNCSSCGSEETIEHFMLHCPRYFSHRVVLRSNLVCLGVRDMSLETLLGGGDFDKEMKIKINKRVCIYIRNCGKDL